MSTKKIMSHFRKEKKFRKTVGTADSYKNGKWKKSTGKKTTQFVNKTSNFIFCIIFLQLKV